MSDEARTAAVKRAIELLSAKRRGKSPFYLGLGSGRASLLFLSYLIKEKSLSTDLFYIASSKQTDEVASRYLQKLDERTFPILDLYIDGADEVDFSYRAIKGGGGALTREKILWRHSKQSLILIEEEKFVEQLGSHFKKLPLEILPFAAERTVASIGYPGTFRSGYSDNGNLLFDIDLTACKTFPNIQSVPGLIETGLFKEKIDCLLIGKKDGSVQTLFPSPSKKDEIDF